MFRSETFDPRIGHLELKICHGIYAMTSDDQTPNYLSHNICQFYLSDCFPFYKCHKVFFSLSWDLTRFLITIQFAVCVMCIHWT